MKRLNRPKLVLIELLLLHQLFSIPNCFRSGTWRLSWAAFLLLFRKQITAKLCEERSIINTVRWNVKNQLLNFTTKPEQSSGRWAVDPRVPRLCSLHPQGLWGPHRKKPQAGTSDPELALCYTRDNPGFPSILDCPGAGGPGWWVGGDTNPISAGFGCIWEQDTALETQTFFLA